MRKNARVKKGSGTRSSLLWEVQRLLSECDELPDVLFMENSPQIHSKKNIDDFKQWIDFLESLGYKNYCSDLNAIDYNVPQNRERCFMFSVLGDYRYDFPNPIGLHKTVGDLLQPNADFKYYRKQTDSVKSLFLNSTVSVKQATKTGYIKCKSGGVLDVAYPKSKTRRGRVQGGGDICPTLTQTPNHILLVTSVPVTRVLTPLECWRLMSFSDDDFVSARKVSSTESVLYKRAGRSIVKNVCMAMFSQLNMNGVTSWNNGLCEVFM